MYKDVPVEESPLKAQLSGPITDSKGRTRRMDNGTAEVFRD